MKIQVLLIIGLVLLLVECKKFKISQPKQLTEYDQCKLKCKSRQNVLTKLEYVEQLRKELEVAQTFLTAENEENKNSTRKISRYDHLKAAASKIVESGSELKQAVTGGTSN